MISALTDNTLSYNLWYMNPLFAVMGAAYGVAGIGGNGCIKDVRRGNDGEYGDAHAA
jgi:hypothetical protein